MEQDAIDTLEFLKEQPEIDPNGIILHGRSLGGAVATYLASEAEVAGVILENTFTSLTNIGDSICPLVKIFEKEVVSEPWPSIDRIHKIKCPMLFVSS